MRKSPTPWTPTSPHRCWVRLDTLTDWLIDRWKRRPGRAGPRHRPWVVRNGSEFSADIRMCSDGNLDHVGWSAWDTGRTVLYQDGEQIFEIEEPGFAFADLPPDEASYRLETTATRSVSGFSTQISAAWSFQSSQTDQVTALPVAAIRFMPRLDDDGEAAVERWFTIPVVVQWQPGAPQLPLQTLTVDVSFDGGVTWSPTTVERHKGEWSVGVKHPVAPGSVSLRAAATDVAGNSMELTIIDAYRIG